ncbi:STAS domain-containing protein [Streptomyces sp. NPDC060334]|uniref:STAS domain-containing protein n=1 Tax=unclassified Streptomyces TaxID=2593676 RepID=UPI003647F0FF
MNDHDESSRQLGLRAPLCLVRVAGDLDLDADRAALDAALRRAVADPDSPTLITVDVSELVFCDSTGLNILLRAQLAALTHGRTIQLRSPNRQLLRLLHRTGAIALFTLDTPPAA